MKNNYKKYRAFGQTWGAHWFLIFLLASSVSTVIQSPVACAPGHSSDRHRRHGHSLSRHNKIHALEGFPRLGQILNEIIKTSFNKILEVGTVPVWL